MGLGRKSKDLIAKRPDCLPLCKQEQSCELSLFQHSQCKWLALVAIL